MADEVVEKEIPSLNVDDAVADIASSLGLDKSEPKEDDTKDDIVEGDVVDEPVKEPVKAEPAVRPVPSSWSKEQHERWGKIDPATQEYIQLREKQMLDGLEQYKGDSGLGKQMREVINPYKAALAAQGIDEAKAVAYLLNAHYRLTQGTPEQRQAAYKQLGANVGLVEAASTEGMSPETRALQDRLDRIESGLTAREQASLNEAKTRVSKDVEAFASDTAHPHFDEVADDIVAMIKSGYELKDAYEKAVWANPVTRAKEMARLQTENEAKLREKAKADAAAAVKAKGSNVRSRDTRRAPTEPLGTMDDTLNEVLAEIRSRPH